MKSSFFVLLLSFCRPHPPRPSSYSFVHFLSYVRIIPKARPKFYLVTLKSFESINMRRTKLNRNDIFKWCISFEYFALCWQIGSVSEIHRPSAGFAHYTQKVFVTLVPGQQFKSRKITRQVVKVELNAI